MERGYSGSRDPRFVLIERGGLLDTQTHRSLVLWSARCAERVLMLFEQECPNDSRPTEAIAAARSWVRGGISVAEARRFSSAAHAAAREATGAAREAARAAGHAVATAHMADHQLGGPWYALRALRAAYPDNLEKVAEERIWQRKALTEDISELVLDDMKIRTKKFQHLFSL
jgi:hypothetical protein